MTAATPMALPSAMMPTTLFRVRDAAAGGARRSAVTRRVPIAWYDAMTASATNAMRARLARSGRRPSVKAFRSSKASAVKARWYVASPTIPMPRADPMSQSEHPDEQDADRGVVREPCALRERANADCHDCRGYCGASHGWEAKQDRDGDPWKDPVRKRFAEEGHTAQHDPRANAGTQDGGERAAEEGSGEEARLEGVSEKGHEEGP